uniref:DH domain-containing protein n=1 Tax=Macrostomum lignano TaxID=282301 RepID=A0A1I8G5V4_9PLAT
ESQSSWTPVEVDAIFEHLPELLSLHKKLLRELEVATQLRGAKPLPAVLISYHNQLLLYGNYCAHMTEAISLLEDACREELQRHLTAAKAQFKLNEYLAVPMQRVLRYHLLVRSLMDYDRKEGGKDKELLKRGSRCYILPLADFSLGRKSKPRRSISSLDMPGSLRLIDYGRLEQDGDLRIANDVSKPNGSSKLRVCFLWTRMFMMAKPRPGLTFKTAFAVKPNLFIREVDLASPNQLANSSASGPAGNRLLHANNASGAISSLDMPGSLRLIDYGRLEQDGDLRIANDVSKPNGSSKLRVCFLWTRMFMMAKPRPGLTFKTAFAVKPNLFIREVDLASPNQLANSSASGPAGNRSTTSSAFQRAKDDVAPANYNCNGYFFERRTLDPPAMCTGYKCRKSGHVVHKQCIPTSVIAPPSANNHGVAVPSSSRPQSLISPAPPRSPALGAGPVRRDTISYVAPTMPEPTGSPRSPISPGRVVAAAAAAPAS